MTILDLNTYHYIHPSGLNVYYFKDDSMTEFSAKLAVNYGSLELNDEIVAGSAHFLEHIMFHNHGQDYMDQFTEFMATSNAYTTYTHTCYEFSTSTNFLQPLNVLFNMVNSFGATVNSIEKEREIINEELKMYAQMPSEIIRDYHYNNVCKDSNYRFDIGGSIKSISKLNINNLKTIFEKYYVASNQTLFCTSSVEFSAIVNQVDNFYNNIEFTPIEFLNKKKESFNKPKTLKYACDVQTNITKVSYVIKQELSTYDYLFLKASLDTLTSELNPEYKKALLKMDINESFYYTIIKSTEINMIEFSLYSKDYAYGFIKLCNNLINSINQNPYIEYGIRKLIGNEIRKMDDLSKYRDYYVHYYYNGLINEGYLDALFDKDIVSKITKYKFESIYNHPYITNIYPKDEND